MGALRALYDWTLKWAAHKHAGTALFVLAFLESSIFPIPPDVLLVALVVAAPFTWKRLALITISGSILGGIAGYLIGFAFFEVVGQPIIDFYHAEAAFQSIGEKYNEFAFLTVLAAAFSPIPYKVITISAGVFKVNFVQFLLASIIGRSIRYTVIAFLLQKYGEPMKAFIDKYFDKLAILFTLLLIGGFIAIKYLF